MNTCDAVLIPQNRGFRFYTREKGDFDSEAVSYTFSEIEGEYQIKTAHSVIVITAGDDWKICADEKFVLDADNFKSMIMQEAKVSMCANHFWKEKWCMDSVNDLMP